MALFIAAVFGGLVVGDGSAKLLRPVGVTILMGSLLRTPPLRLNRFVVSGITGESILKIVHRAVPFVFFPQIVTLMIACFLVISTTLLPDIYK